MWKAAGRPILKYGIPVWTGPSADSESRLEKIQERAAMVILGVCWRFLAVVVRGDLGLKKTYFRDTKST